MVATVITVIWTPTCKHHRNPAGTGRTHRARRAGRLPQSAGGLPLVVHAQHPARGVDGLSLRLWYIFPDTERTSRRAPRRGQMEDAMSNRILVIEDDEAIIKFLRRGLAYERYEVDVATDGLSGLQLAQENTPDLVVLDLMLPGLDGLEVCRRLRTFSNVPILILTARDSVNDRVMGLDMGADDYMVKPFNLDELLARIRALLRRTKPSVPQVLQFADLKLDTGTRQASRGERVISLTSKEYDLLELFMMHPRQVLTRDFIFDRVWNYDFGGDSNIIEVYMRYLRQKLEANGEPRLLHTVRGVGYVLREPN